MKQCFDRLNLNWEEEGITQESIDTMAKSIKKGDKETNLLKHMQRLQGVQENEDSINNN